MAKNQRFEKIYSQGTMSVTEIWVDKETGINYLYHASGYSGGLTPLLDREGKPVISSIVIVKLFVKTEADMIAMFEETSTSMCQIVITS